MALYLLVTIAIQTCKGSTLHFFTSPKTPFRLESVISKLSETVSSQIQYSIEELEALSQVDERTEDTLFDYTYDLELSSALKRRDSSVLVMWTHSHWSVGVSFDQYGREFTRYLQILHFSKVTVISDSSLRNLRLSQFLLELFPSVYEELHTIPFAADEAFCFQFIGQIIKPSGANLFAIITDAVTSLHLLTAFDSKKMNKEGYVYILSDQASYYQQLPFQNVTGLLSTGVLYVADATTALTESVEEAEALVLESTLRKVINGQSSSYRIEASNHSFVLVNIIESLPKIVISRLDGSRTGGWNLSLPGGTSTLPTDFTAQIPISVNYYFLDSTEYLFPLSRTVMRGAQVAIEETNNRTDVLKNFKVATVPVAFSGLIFNYTFTKLQVANDVTRLGVIHIPPPLGTNIISTFRIFAELNLTLPMTTGSSTTELSSPSNYPLFVRAKTTNAYNALVMARMFSFFGWRSAAVLYSEDQGDNQDFYTAFMKLTNVTGINITNAEGMRRLSSALLTDNMTQLNASIADIMKSSVRIVIILHNELFTVLETMYDLGVRSGGYLICTYYGLSYALLYGEGVGNVKIRTVAKGALQFQPRPFINEQGKKVLDSLRAWDGMHYFPNSCYLYDCTMLYLHSTNYMLQRGIDYEDPYKIVEAMRGTRFTGCAGNIQIDPGSNDRVAAQFSVMNFKYNAENDTGILEDVIYYNPFSTIMYQQIKPIQWPDDSEAFTDVFVSDYPCPFLEKEVQQFNPGIAVGFSVLFSVCSLTIISSYFIWKRWWRVKQEVLTKKCHVSAEDVWQLVTVPLMFFQIIAFGPSPKSLSSTIDTMSALLSLHMIDIFSTGSGMYIVILNCVLGFVFVYAVTCGIKLCKWEDKVNRVPYCSMLMQWADSLLTTWSNLLFLPVVSTLLEAFLCYKSVGNSFLQSFLNNDCYQFCWQGAHLAYVVLSALALLIYLPLALFTRPLWQEMLPYLHIKANPLALMVKSVVDVSLVVLDSTLRDDYFYAHSALYLLTITGYTICMLLYRQFNYDLCELCRLNLWQVICMFAVVFYEVETVYSIVSPSDNSTTQLICFLGVCLLLLALGFIVQCKVKRFEGKLILHLESINDSANIVTLAHISGRYLDRVHPSLQVVGLHRVHESEIALNT